MKNRFIIANWKSNKTSSETKAWLEKFKEISSGFSSAEVDIIVCPPFTLLFEMKRFIDEQNLPIKLGTQNISPFGEGAYTGEVTAKEAKDFVTHAIVGHSERRKYFSENDEQVLAKIKQLVENDITPILCISDMKQLKYYLKEDEVLVTNAEKILFVYEPPGAISGGGAFHADGSDDIKRNVAEIETMINKAIITLYGGSINPDNASSLFAIDNVSGGLVGQASLDAEKFVQIITS